jgi:hypothetical protein
MNWFKFFLLLLMANPIVAYSEIEIADVFGLVSKNPNKSLKFVELRSATNCLKFFPYSLIKAILWR